MKEFSFPNSGTCSKQTNIVLNDDHTIESVEVIGGCNGNLQGISRLVEGMKADDMVRQQTTAGLAQSLVIVTDSAADLPEDIAERYAIGVVPARVDLDGRRIDFRLVTEGEELGGVETAQQPPEAGRSTQVRRHGDSAPLTARQRRQA